MIRDMELDYRKYESQYGVMYHLLLDRVGSKQGIRYVTGDDPNPRYLSLNGYPVFFNWDKEFLVATKYTIIFPKIYVLESTALTQDESKLMSRQYIQ